MDEGAENGMGTGPASDSPVAIPVARPVVVESPIPTRITTDPLLLLDLPPGKAWIELGLGLLLLITWIIVVESAAYLMVAPLHTTPDTLAETARSLFVPTILIRTVGVVGVLALLLRGSGQRFRSVGVHRSALGINALVGVGATAVAYVLIVILMTIMWLTRPQSLDQLTENAERLIAMIPKLHPLAFLPVAILVGVYEELLFRGFLMTRLRRGTGSWTIAVLVSTGIFTALHAMDQTNVALVAIASLSLVVSFVTIWRRSILPAIVTHTLFNYSQFLSLYVQAGDSWK